MRKRPNIINKALRLIFVVLFILALVSSSGAVFAMSEVGFGILDEDPIWFYDNVTVYSDSISSIDSLFGISTEDLFPGQHETVFIRLVNNSDEAFTFYLNAAILSDEESIKLESYHPGKVASDSLLRSVDTVVRYQGGNIYTLSGVIYSGKLVGQIGAAMYSARGVPLGTLGPNDDGLVSVSISVPSHLDNSYMNTVCAVKWWFTAERAGDDPFTPPPTTTTTGGRPSPATSPATSPLVSPGDDPTEIIPTDPPLIEIEVSPGPDGTKIDDGSVPRGEGPDGTEVSDLVVVVSSPGRGLPQTGGIETYVFVLVIALSLLLVLLVVTYIEKRKPKE